MYLNWSSFNNIRMLSMACMPIVIFYFIWLVNTSEAIRSEEGTLLDLVCWPDGNAIPVIIACGSIIAVVIELYGLHQLFKAGLPKGRYNVTNGLYYYVWALIVMILVFLAIVFYAGLQSTIIRDHLLLKRGKTRQVTLGRECASMALEKQFSRTRIRVEGTEWVKQEIPVRIKGGITKAMHRYSSHLPSKVAIDRLQTRFHCCGRVTYQEWFYIPWFITGQDTDDMKDDRFVGDNVPYSCCSMEAIRPCIHHGVTKKGVTYKYDPKKDLTIWQDGCEEKLINEMMTVSWRFITVIALIIVAMILQVTGARYLHTAYKNGLHAGNPVKCEAYLLRSMTETALKDSLTERRTCQRRSKDVRTLKWLTSSYNSIRKRYDTSSISDVNSSDELLQPIHE